MDLGVVNTTSADITESALYPERRANAVNARQ
jgi:hypothetical protein